VRFDLWSVPSGRKVVISEPVTSNHTKASDVTEVDPSLPVGAAQRVEWPHDGFDATVTRTVTDASGAVIHADTFFSHYGVVNGVTLVNPG
jgi:hypothetical protein